MQTEYAILYIEINVFALAIIAIILWKTWGLTAMMAQKNFSMSLDSLALFFLSDTVYMMIKCGMLPHSVFLIMLMKELYFFATTLMCYFWFVYFEYLQGSPFVESKKRIIQSSALVWVMAALLIVNLFNGMLFYVDDSGIYQRGPLFVLQYLISYAYVVLTCGRAVLGIFSGRSHSSRRDLILLALFPVMPALAGIVQFVHPELPMACFALSIAILIMYLSWLDKMISIDPLTRLNNRKQLAHYFEHSLSGTEEAVSSYLMMIDANKFKMINDTYGHVEGDAALIRIADALRSACRKLPYRANIARYGGDEFVIITASPDDETIDNLKNMINTKLTELNNASRAPYQLTVSIGTVRITQGSSLAELIAHADKAMYKEKRG